MLGRQQVTISADVPQAPVSGHRHIRIFGHLIHLTVNKYLINFSLYSSQAKSGQFIVLENVSTARDDPYSNRERKQE